jgi:hypothetical protein
MCIPVGGVAFQISELHVFPVAAFFDGIGDL